MYQLKNDIGRYAVCDELKLSNGQMFVYIL